MRLPIIHGLIRRRILVNFRIDPDVIQRQLPPPFRPMLHSGHAVAGICLIRLEKLRPKGFPAALGASSENAAHRIAVTWSDGGRERQGVYIPRRDTDSLLNHIAGGRFFPGEHHRAAFDVRTEAGDVNLQMRSRDGEVAVKLESTIAESLPPASIFGDLGEASRFFERGGLGFSATSDPARLDGIELRTETWRIEPLHVSSVHSSYFADQRLFPPGSASFDCALLMRDIRHQWHTAPDMHIGNSPARQNYG